MLDSLIVAGLSVLSLGTIQEADGVVERTFWLRNVGAASVPLMQGYTSCGCTTIQFAKGQTVAPGDSTSVSLRFNPRGKGGEFYESGTIVYGAERKRVEMALQGDCVTSEETLQRQYPIVVSDSLRLSADHFDLGIMRTGETKERTVVALHTGENRRERIPVVFTAGEDVAKGLQHISCPVEVGRRKVLITLDVVIR